ncbi:MAG: hypothetical protein EA417_17650 [Gammaproteobacteria bacterium]|nr:MAG: hypothetical protein EA417_17650 [Gammaproteobacteria bacterium]
MITKRATKRSWLTGLSTLACIALPAVATAQDQPEQTRTDASAGYLPVITVSASRRTTDNQDVAIAVTVVNAEQLDRAGVADITTLDAVVPSFNLNASGTTP